MIVLTLNNVRKKYKNKKVLDGVNINIKSPGIYWLKGNNGEGKSTLFNVLSECIKYEGVVKNDYIKNMGYIFQGVNLVEYLTIREQLILFNIDVAILKDFNLVDKLDCHPCSLSSGERQRLALILILYSNYDLILLDEPFSNLDNKNKKIFKKKLLMFKKNKIIIIISHQDDVKDICDCVFNLKDGKLKSTKINHEKEMKSSLNVNKKINNGYKYYKKHYLKIYVIYFICFLLLATCNLSKVLMNVLANKDINESVDYNKFYLKSCKEFNNDGFKVSKCNNPNEENLTDNWGYNYDLLLLFLYKNENIRTFDNDVVLKEGKIPQNYNQVLANDKYKIGDKITIEANQVIKKEKVDFLKDTIVLEVVGIYNDLTFYNESKIYLKYDLIEEYFKNKILKNNKISIYQYYKELEIDGYKYLSFEKNENSKIIFEGEKYSYYESIRDVINKVDSILSYFKIFIFAFLFYVVIKMYKNMLVLKQKSISFLIVNSFNRKTIIKREMLLVIMPILFISFIFTMLSHQREFMIFNFVYIGVLICVLLLMTNLFYSRKNISKLLREEIW